MKCERQRKLIRSLGDPSGDYLGRQAYWIRADEDSNNNDQINLKMLSAFQAVKSFPFDRIIFQFWRPLTDDGGRLVLESLRNSYALSPCDRLLHNKYKFRCIKYQYIVDDNDDQGNNPLPAWIIRSRGPVTAAFLNHFPEVGEVQMMGSPLGDCALECKLSCCMMLPVFNAGSCECLGVVECSMKRPHLLLPIFLEMKQELERVGLSINGLQGTCPYKTISGDLEAAKIEIENALEIASESHALTLGQVWIPSTCKMFLVKLSRYSDDRPLSSVVVKEFYDKFDVISLKTGEGLARKTLQTHQPHLCRNICKLSDNRRGVFTLLSANSKSKCASFVICLRSTHTGDLDYVFEFFWPVDRNHFILLETLLLTLNKYLPSFKFVSGEQLGDELFVVDVENSSSSTPVKISTGIKTLVGVKRKSVSGQSELTSPEGDDDEDLAILAAYRKQNSLFYLPSSSTLENVMEKLKKEFELDPTQTYKVEYEAVSGQWSSLACLESCRRIEDNGLVKLRVLPTREEVSLRWITNPPL